MSNFIKLSISNLEGVGFSEMQILHLIAPPEQTLDGVAATGAWVGE